MSFYFYRYFLGFPNLKFLHPICHLYCLKKGLYCDILVDPCSPNPCVSGQGYCQPFSFSNGTIGVYYKCNCLSGFTGEICANQIDTCTNTTCSNGGKCLSMNGYHICQCPSNYYGVGCEFVYGCSLSPCDKVGTLQCIDLLDTQTTNYKCNCRKGFTGLNCESDINECASDPCRNNGSCVDLTNGFICQCSGYFEGVFCEISYDSCAFSQCLNNGTCSNTINGYYCSCPSPFTGPKCEQLIDACAYSQPCQNGLCISFLNNTFKCQCPPGYTGLLCDEDINEVTIFNYDF
jgi:hypothetical protein